MHAIPALRYEYGKRTMARVAANYRVEVEGYSCPVRCGAVAVCTALGLLTHTRTTVTSSSAADVSLTRSVYPRATIRRWVAEYMPLARLERENVARGCQIRKSAICACWPAERLRRPTIVHDHAGKRKGLMRTYGLIPKRHMPPGQRLTTMNARAETVGQLRTYKSAWAKSQLCLVPMVRFFEPNWEQPAPVRWSIGMANGEPFAVAGLYREWEEEDGKKSFSFTQLTINADDDSLMKRFHRPSEEKRSLVIVPSADYDEWLGCMDPERARRYLLPCPAELMAGQPAPKAAVVKQHELF